MSKPLVLVVNCGSSSVKFAIIDCGSGQQKLSGLAECLQQPEAVIHWNCEGNKQSAPLPTPATHQEALQFIVATILPQSGISSTDLLAIGHRIVHGGEKLTQPVVIDSAVLAEIEANQRFAPLHNPAALLGIQAAFLNFPQQETRNVAVFDTAFHQTLPEEAYLYALPYRLYQQHDIRRYGFHGISHQFVSEQAAQRLGKPVEQLNAITCHLGNGASIAAVRQGKSVDTSMGLTPLAGLVMGTRCGDIDPAILFYLHDTLELPLPVIHNLLIQESGLLGLSEGTSDCRLLEQRYLTHASARRALNCFCYSIAKYIAAYTAALGDRFDLLVFTGGIGENSALVRQLVLERLELLNFTLDPAANLAARFGQSANISLPGHRPAWVIPTDEARLIAQQAQKLLGGTP
ncbi:MAG: acetate kinase [Candidatus Symbiodolus clandestinus]